VAGDCWEKGKKPSSFGTGGGEWRKKMDKTRGEVEKLRKRRRGEERDCVGKCRRINKRS
jgi:hypothetical protein